MIYIWFEMGAISSDNGLTWTNIKNWEKHSCTYSNSDTTIRFAGRQVFLSYFEGEMIGSTADLSLKLRVFDVDDLYN